MVKKKDSKKKNYKTMLFVSQYLNTHQMCESMEGYLTYKGENPPHYGFFFTFSSNHAENLGVGELTDCYDVPFKLILLTLGVLWAARGHFSTYEEKSVVNKEGKKEIVYTGHFTLDADLDPKKAPEFLNYIEEKNEHNYFTVCVNEKFGDEAYKC